MSINPVGDRVQVPPFWFEAKFTGTPSTRPKVPVTAPETVNVTCFVPSQALAR